MASFQQLMLAAQTAASSGVAFDAASTGAAATAVTVSHTCTGSNIVLLTWFFFSNAARSGLTVTYGAASMTFVGTFDNGAVKVELWKLIGASAGTANVVATATAGPPTTVSVINESFTGATSIGSLFTNSASSSNAPTITITSGATNELMADAVVYTAGSSRAYTPAGGQDIRGNVTTDSDLMYASSTKAGASSVTISGSIAALVDWCDVGIAVKP